MERSVSWVHGNPTGANQQARCYCLQLCQPEEEQSSKRVALRGSCMFVVGRRCTAEALFLYHRLSRNTEALISSAVPDMSL